MVFTRLTAALFALLMAVVPASAEVYDWSQTPASNNTSDTASDIQWSEGMNPSDVNDSARAMMAELRKFIDDLGAYSTSTTMQTSAGTSTAYTLTTQGSADNLENGRQVCFVVDEGNGADPTINVDSLGAKHIFIADGTTLTGGEMVANTIQCLSYDAAANSAAGGWMMRNRFVTVEAGGGIENDGSTGALQRSALTGDVTASAGSNATTIANNAVTYAKMQDVSATDKFIGRDTAGSGDPEEIGVAAAAQMLCGTDPNADRFAFWDDSAGSCAWLAPDSSLSISGTTLSRAALTGDVTASAGSNATTVAADAVALSTDTTGNYVTDIADGTGIDGTCSSEGCTYTPTFDPTEISSGTWGAGSFTSFTFNASAGSDPVETFGDGSVTWTSVTNFGIDNQGALRLYEGDGGGSNYVDVKAPSTLASNRTCTLEDDSTPFDSCVTPPSGVPDTDKGDITTSSSGTVYTIDNDVVTYAKMQNVTATDRLLGRDTAGAGDPEEIAVSGGLEFTGSLGLQTSAFTGDVTKSAGGTVTTIAADAVALGTDTTGNYVGTITDGTGIDGTCTSEGCAAALSIDFTEITAGTGLTATNATTLDCDTASTTVVGCAELATSAEAEARSDTGRTVTPSSLANFTVQTLATAQVTTSGTAFDFTSIPAGVKQITVMFDQVSLSGTDNFLIQLGDAGGVETSGYVGSSLNMINSNAINGASSATGCVVTSNSASSVWTGTLTFTNIASNTWIASGVTANSSGGTTVNATCSKGTSATLNQVRITRDGTNTFDAGQVSIYYQY